MKTTPGFIKAIRLNRENISSFKKYPFSIPAIKNLHHLTLHPSVTFFVGENGSGKSTLIEALAVKSGLNAEGGSHNFNFASRESHSDLSRYLTLERSPRKATDRYFLRAESFFNVATEIEKLDEDPQGGPRVLQNYGGVSLHEQSHGESFFALMSNRFGGNGLYILDEPEAALSPQRQMSMLVIMDNLVKQGSQLIIATHSPILTAYPNALIYQLSENKIEKVPYTKTEPYLVTRDFLNRHEKMLEILIEPPDLVQKE